MKLVLFRFVVVMIFLHLLSHPTIGQTVFTQTMFPVPLSGGSPSHNGPFIKSGDFNSDGWLDIVIVDPGASLQVLLNSGLGSFAAAQSYQILPGTNGAINLDVADLNEDGNLDIVVSPINSFGAGVGAGIFYGTGTGIFNPITFPAIPVTQTVAVGDFNNDTHKDILSTYPPTGTLLLGDGGGSFLSTSIAGVTLRNIQVADLNLDGNLDYIHYDGSSDVYSSLGNGAGVFAVVAGITTGDTFAFASNIDQDNIPDLISKSCCDIRVYKGIGDGSFQTTPVLSAVPANNAGEIRDVHIVDINSDGIDDIIETHVAASGPNPTLLGVFLGNGAGSFGPSTIVASSSASRSFYQFQPADYNNDGKVDIAAIDRTGSLLHILLNASVLPPAISSFTPTSGPIGTIVSITGTNFSGTAANNTVYFGDVRATVISATSTQLVVTVPPGATYRPIIVQTAGLVGYANEPFVVTFAGSSGITDCSFAPKASYSTGNGPYKISSNDLDGDGITDLVVTNRNSHTVSVLMNSTTGPGSVAFMARQDYATGLNPRGVSLSDVDGDGKADLIVANYGSNTMSVLRNTSPGPGTISYASKEDFATGVFPDQVATGDLDNDGRIDLAVANTNSNTVSVFRNASSGPGDINFVARVDFSTGTMPYEVAIADLDGDGRAELVVENTGSNTVSVFRNISTGPGNIDYAAKVDFATGAVPFGLSLGDLDDDGKIDVVVANETDNTVSVLRNTSIGPGSIAFAAKVDLATGSTPYQVSMSDLDGDNRIDLAVANGGSGTISILRNTGSGPGSISYASKIDFATGSSHFGLVSSDVDGDGKTDLSVTDFGSNAVFVLRSMVGEILPPTISSFAPSTGPIGVSVTITGTNFSTPFANSVEFNGVPAIITASSATNITTTIPAGATTGPITLTVGCGTVTSVTDFTITPHPAIVAFTPSSGFAGTIVVINGTGFDPVPTNNAVEFNGTAAIVTASSSTSITAIVPAGAVSGFISVTTPWGTSSSGSPFVIDLAHSPIGNTVQLNGITDRIEIPNNVNMQSGSLTLEAWVSFNSVPGFAAIAAKSEGATTNNSFALWYESGRLSGGVNALSVASAVSFAWTPVVNRWYHVALTYDNGTQVQTLYLNGTAVSSGTRSAPVFDGQPFLLGADSNSGSLGGYFHGELDEVRLWSVPRTPSEIQSALGSALVGTETALVAYYNMDEVGRGAAIHVSNSAGFTGTQLDGLTYGTTCTPVFTLVPQTISSLAPSFGSVGTVVVIAGSNFSSTHANNTVRFNGIAASVTAATPTTITVVVPAGAMSGPVEVSIGCVTVVGGVFCLQSPPTPIVGDGCAGTGISIGAGGATSGQYRWYTVPAGGAAIPGETGNAYTTPALMSTTTYYVAINNGICESARTGVTAIVHPMPSKPAIASGGSLSFCPGESVALMAPDGFASYLWSDGVATQTRIESSVVTLSVKVTDGNGCESVDSDPITTQMHTPPLQPVISTVGPTTFCQGSSVVLTADSGYAAYMWSNGAISRQILVTDEATYSVQVVDVNGCISVPSGAITTNVLALPPVPVVSSSKPATNGIVALCAESNETTTVSVPAGYSAYLWNNGRTENSFQANQPGSYSVTVNNSAGCFVTAAATFSISVVSCRPAISAASTSVGVGGKASLSILPLISARNAVEVGSLSVVRQPSSGARANIDGSGILNVDYNGVSFVGNESITIQACDVQNICATQDIEIEVIGKVEVYNALSPGNDGKNDIFLIKYIDVIAETKQNHVSIFNRWGDVVWEVDDYDNVQRVFTGKSKSGTDLPTGVYFYKVVFNSGAETLQGYISLRR